MAERKSEGKRVAIITPCPVNEGNVHIHTFTVLAERDAQSPNRSRQSERRQAKGKGFSGQVRNWNSEWQGNPIWGTGQAKNVRGYN